MKNSQRLAAAMSGAFVLAAASLAIDGREIARYGFYHCFDGSQPFENDCTDFASKCQFAGGLQMTGYADRLNPANWFYYEEPRRIWASETWWQAQAFEQFQITSRRSQLVYVVWQGGWRSVCQSPVMSGDFIVADWGAGDESKPPEANRADGKAHHIMTIIETLPNGDRLYVQHSDKKIRLLSSVVNSPSLKYAQFRVYHVLGNDSMRGLAENQMYRDSNRSEVFVHVNGGLFWVHTLNDVIKYGGWGSIITTSPDYLHAGNGTPPLPGTMVKETHDSRVWLANGVLRHWIRSESAVKKYGDWSAIREVPDGSLSTSFAFIGDDIW